MTGVDHHRFTVSSGASEHQVEQLAIDQLKKLADSHRKFACILITPYVLAEQDDENAAEAAVKWLSKLPIQAVARTGARVYLWSPGPHVFRLLEVLPGWDCYYETAAMCVVPSRTDAEVSLLFQSSCGIETGRSLACNHVLPCLNGARLVNEDHLRAALEKPGDEERLHVFGRTPAPGWMIVGT